MSVPVMYAFLTDSALKQSSTFDSDSSYNQGFGILDGELANYFHNKGIINDNRASRLQIVENHTAGGSLSLVFDQDRFDTTLFRSMSDIEFTLLFNIIERLYLQQYYSDSNIEHLLVNNSTFQGYVQESYSHGDKPTVVKITDVNKAVKEVQVYDWYSFEFYMQTGERFKIRFWLNEKSFAKDYPYTTITKVLPPYSPAQLINPASLVTTGNLSVLTSSSSYIFSEAHKEMAIQDQNGVATYYTKYILDGRTTLSLPFGLAYRGAKEPSSLECRKAIRDFMEENTNLTEEALMAIFPELFINARFFVVPMYDLVSDTISRTVYPSILQYKKLEERARAVFYQFNTEFRDEYLEILTNAQNKMFCISMPDELNDKIFSIREEHPTYQDYSTQIPGWKYMETSTQEFAGKLIRCMAILSGETTSDEFTQETVGMSKFLAFTAGKAEFLVMERASYEELIRFLGD